MASDKNEKMDFKSGDLVVYPAHGVGEITAIDELNIAGEELKVYSISFRETKMTLRLPCAKAKTAGLRKLTSRDRFKEAMKTLQGRAKKSRTMWSRRAQEYDAKIKSGDPVMIAEVVRDLHPKDEAVEQSYSERQIYQAALGRLARELAAIEKIDEKKAADKIETMMKKVA
ncbi:MAG: CarD family transcriptional regulator [Bdellovibrionales bacterium]